ncbi:hypothetical protein RJ639_011853 [Escallonia herrerae]|uniref:Dynein light chain n=1 Tax=Escallonia herrerae TaxID=1293975 RepID=A0AA88VMF2_9ASTE|nr:hypothetical protein RJ639_011853 [Escallonia herrerae]
MLEGKAVVGETDMLQTMQQEALDIAAKALNFFDITEATEIARLIKKVMRLRLVFVGIGSVPLFWFAGSAIWSAPISDVLSLYPGRLSSRTVSTIAGQISLKDSESNSRLDTFPLLFCNLLEFDRAYGPGWQCIVGTDFGSFVTHCYGCFIHFSVGSLAILLFKGSAGPELEAEQFAALDLETVKA